MPNRKLSIHLSFRRTQVMKFNSLNMVVWVGGQFGVNNHWISSFCMPKPISDFAYAYGDEKLYDSIRLLTSSIVK
ncbi:hypothetical protein EZS27_030322 [termite gut metagenome]|uniref:Uncharacterized protein n=1 Tax=termite gut metagenome TaxID=433724 RepID=A0A5J4QFL7_9ZZZZ